MTYVLIIKEGFEVATSKEVECKDPSTMQAKEIIGESLVLV